MKKFQRSLTVLLGLSVCLNSFSAYTVPVKASTATPIYREVSNDKTATSKLEQSTVDSNRQTNADNNTTATDNSNQSNNENNQGVDNAVTNDNNSNNSNSGNQNTSNSTDNSNQNNTGDNTNNGNSDIENPSVENPDTGNNDTGNSDNTNTDNNTEDSNTDNNNQEEGDKEDSNTDGTETEKPEKIKKVKMSLQFKLTSRKNQSVRLSWEKVKHAVKYEVFQLVNDEWKSIKKTKSLSYNVSLKKLEKEEQYFVQAFDKKDNMIGESKEIKVGIPKTVSNLRTTALSKTKVRLNWTSSPIAHYYEIYSRSTGSTYKYIGKTKKYEFTNKVTYDTNYYYKVVPVYSKKEGTIKGDVTKIIFKNKEFVSINHQNYSYNEMSEDIKELEAKYSDYVEVTVLGKSEQGRNIYDVAIGNKNAKKKLLVVSTLHAREYVATVVCMKQAEYYLQNYNNKIDGKKPADVFGDCQVHYVMMSNPDGVTISQTSNRYTKDNANGVNLNSNFPYKFKEKGKKGQSSYTGSHAGSEKETQAIVSLSKKLKKSGLVGVVNYHAMGSIVFGDCSKKLKIEPMTTKMYQVARKTTGYRDAGGYSSGSSGTSTGSYREYIMFKLKTPSITIEVGTTPCPVSYFYYPSIWQKNRFVILREADLF